MTYYTVYKTVNLLNGKFYFGVHKTKDPDDEYLGSGTYIKRAVAKYGEQNLRKEVLFIYLDAESAFGKEDELIQCWREHPLCKNLRKGGSGGFDYINREGLADYANAARVSHGSQSCRDPQHYKMMSDVRAKQIREHGIEPDVSAKISETSKRTWTGRKHRPETIAKMTLTDRAGKKNSQYGTCWITDGVKNLKVKQNDLAPYVLIGWRRGRV
jgi:hypothetical protein